MITNEQFEYSRAQARADDENERIRRRLLRSSDTVPSGGTGTLAPTGTAAPSPFLARCREAHAKLGGHLTEATAALRRCKRTLHEDHPGVPIITTALSELQDATNLHQAIGKALDLVEP